MRKSRLIGDRTHDEPAGGKPPNLTDQLALERTRLAYERTFLAYLRTGLAIIGAGATGMYFFPDPWLAAASGLLVPLGILLTIIAFLKRRRGVIASSPDRRS